MTKRPMKNAPRSRRWRPSLLCLLALAAVVAVSDGHVGAQAPAPGVAIDGPPNFDIRDKSVEVDAFAAYRAQHALPSGVAAARATLQDRAEASLKADFRAAVVETHAVLGVPEVIGTEPGTGFLTGPSQNRASALRGFLARYSGAYDIAADQVTDLEVVADYVNPAGNMGWVELEQKINGIPVFQGFVRGGFTPRGELVRTTGLLVGGIDAAATLAAPSVGAGQAVAIAAESVGWTVTEASLTQKDTDATGTRVTFNRGTMADDAKAWLTYFPLSPGVVRLAWATEIWGDPNVFLTLVDAETGTPLFRKNLTNYQTQSATYNVYTSDSPAPSSPTPALPGANYQAPFVARQNHTLIGNEAPNTFNNLGWITDGDNTTDGNNVQAGIDRDGVNGVDVAQTGSPARVFTSTYNPETDDPLTATYQRGDVINMFYWVNRYHDATYLLGFNEVSRNFQNNNFGRGGLGADRISAEGQDSSGTNNANFATPADGGRGRMQMFIWTGPTPDRSGDLDQDVIFHELSHGLSNRLHANGSGLLSNMSGGLGEGWSDFVARSLLATADEDANGVYTIGGWATQLIASGETNNYYYGIRRFPYAPRSAVGSNGRPHSPLTFADIDSTQADLTDGAYPRGPVGPSTVDQVHNIGEVWAGMLWEVRSRFIARLGFAGNQRFLQFVVDGMKLDPVSPTLLQARDSILAAANATGTAADVADIWSGFATRGLGVLAEITNGGTGANNTRVVESYLRPTDPLPSFSINDVSMAEGNAGTTTFNFTVTLANPSVGETRVSFVTANGSATSSESAFSNPATITINDVLPATPYPATINVAGVPGTLAGVAARLDGITHTFPGDLDVVLVAPGGQRIMLMSDAGGLNGMTGNVLTFRDGAAPLTDGAIPTGTYSPTDLTPGENLPAPAPTGPYGTSLSVLNGTNPNGAWSLYVADDAGGDIGSITGFTVLLTVAGLGDYTPAAGTLTFPPGTTTRTASVSVNGDVAIEANETFAVNLSGPVQAVIADGQGIGTILDDDTPLTSQPPTGLYAADIAGNTVTLRWTPPALSLPPTDYILEGGINPGEVLASIPTGSTTPVFTLVAPTGAFYVRMHTMAGGIKSPASNEIRIFVNAPAAPSAPAGLLGTVDGSSLTLAWKNTFEGGTPAGLMLDVSGALSTSIALGVSEGFSFAGVPGGTYTLSLRAFNGVGFSGSSNPVTLTFPGTCSVPQAPTNVIAYRIGGTGYVMWDPPSSGTAPTHYVLNVTGAFVGSFGTAGRILSGGVGPGSYNLSVVAVNSCGPGVAAPTVVLTVP